MNVGIIGFGLIGQQRALSVAKLNNHRLISVTDPLPDRAESLQKSLKYEIVDHWQDAVSRTDINVIIVCVPHHLAPKIVVSALRAGKHVMCEKPLGRNMIESKQMVQAAEQSGLMLEPGFNYRFYPGIKKLRELIENNSIGKITHARCVIGHGGRPGMEKEWKLDKELCGGGALFDPGIHCVDLFRFLFGEIEQATATLWNAFWKIKVEDNALATFKTKKGVIVSLHSSITEWVNRFSLEVIGSEGYLFLSGRSNNYGGQKLILGKRWFWLDNTNDDKKEWIFSPEDNSFFEETKAFLETADGLENQFLATYQDGLKAVEIIENLYDNKQSMPISE